MTAATHAPNTQADTLKLCQLKCIGMKLSDDPSSISYSLADRDGNVRIPTTNAGLEKVGIGDYIAHAYVDSGWFPCVVTWSDQSVSFSLTGKVPQFIPGPTSEELEDALRPQPVEPIEPAIPAETYEMRLVALQSRRKDRSIASYREAILSEKYDLSNPTEFDSLAELALAADVGIEGMRRDAGFIVQRKRDQALAATRDDALPKWRKARLDLHDCEERARREVADLTRKEIEAGAFLDEARRALQAKQSKEMQPAYDAVSAAYSAYQAALLASHRLETLLECVPWLK